MGLFDKLVKEVANRVVDKAIVPEVKRSVNESLGKSIKSVSYDIPGEYSEFPEFSGNMSQRPTIVNTDKYKRVTLHYDNVSSGMISEYQNVLQDNGYTRGSNVRFDKGHTYVIVEEDGTNLKIAYHVKK